MLSDLNKKYRFFLFEEWAEQLFQYGHNPLRRNLSSLECLEKFHTKIVNVLVENRFGKRAIAVQRYIIRHCFSCLVFI